MKLILQLNALFACFLSAKLLRCHKEIIGTVEQSFVDKEPKNFSIACPEIEGAAKLKFCVKEVCFRDGKVEHYVTIYACSVTTAECNTAGRLFMARQECELRNSGNRNVCKEEKNKHEGNYIKKYGNYRCEQCQYGKENEDNGNANYPVYQSKEHPLKPEIFSTAPLPNPENSSVSVPPKPQNGIDIVFSDMEIPLGVPPSGSGRSTEPGIGHHFVMVFGQKREKRTEESEETKMELIRKYDKLRKKETYGLKYDKKKTNKIECEIAKELGINRMKIYKWKKEFGKTKIYMDAEKLDYVKRGEEMRKRNPMISETKIAEKLGIFRSSLRRWTRKFGTKSIR